MVWFRVDDDLAFHRKALKAGNTAMGMWVRAGAECSSQLTDGFVPDELISSLGGHLLARKLVSAGLWHREESGYRFHQWEDRNPARSDVEQDRKAAKERKERWKERRRNAVPNGDGTASGTPTPTRPDPTRPENQVTPLRGARGSRIPDDFEITAEMRQWCVDRGITKAQALRSTEAFVNYWRAKTGRDATKLDWPATWRNWLLKDHPDVKANGDELTRQLLS